MREDGTNIYGNLYLNTFELFEISLPTETGMHVSTYIYIGDAGNYHTNDWVGYMRHLRVFEDVDQSTSIENMLMYMNGQ